MKTSLLLALPLGLTLLSAPASARFYVYSGVGCRAAVPSQVGCIESSQFGVQNACSSPVAVECPLDAGSGVDDPIVTFVSFTGYDRSTVADVSCQVQKVSADGSLLFGKTIKTEPVNGTGAQQPITFPNIGQSGSWRMRCSIPGVQAGQFSHVTSMSMLTSE
jgi:hypothetical protein